MRAQQGIRADRIGLTCSTGRMDEFPRIEETVAPVILRTLYAWVAERGD